MSCFISPRSTALPWWLGGKMLMRISDGNMSCCAAAASLASMRAVCHAGVLPRVPCGSWTDPPVA
jgi:hypothetical protein